MPLESPDDLHLRAAHGYSELEMFDAANAELEEIDSLCRLKHAEGKREGVTETREQLRKISFFVLPALSYHG